jgi:glycosyltransferase involved in cell wall biosynthesis
MTFPRGRLSSHMARRRLRILHVSYSTGLWGAEQALLRLAPLLVARDVAVTLAAPPGGRLHEAWEDLKFPHVALDLPTTNAPLRPEGGGPGRPRPTALARTAREVLRQARTISRLSQDVDVIHSHSLNAHVATALAGRLARRPVVLQQHDLVKPGAGQFVLTTSVHLAHAMSAITDACASCVRPSAQRKVHVIRYGLDLRRFRPGPAAPEVRRQLGGIDGAPLVGIVGRVDPRKQIDVVVDAMARLGPQSSARLAVIGGPQLSSREYVEHLEVDAARRLGDRVRFTGARGDIEEVLRALDVLVNASVAEPFGLTLLEAQASGVPVIATASGGAPEFVRHERTGLLVPPSDGDALARALQRLFDEPALRLRLTLEGRRQVEEHYDEERQADEVRGLYDTVLGEANAPG